MREVKGDPFTVEHFERWAFELTLDSGDKWRVEDFFCAYLEDLFAGVPESWLIVPEGNSKTTSMSGLALYHSEFTEYGWVPWAASSRDQADIGYIQAEGFVERSPRLRSLFKCHPGYRRIKCLLSGSRIQIFAADDRTGDGVIPTLAMLDELHRHRDLRLYRTWRGKIAKRGGQIATFSTAGEPGSEFEETRERIRQTATESRRDGAFLRALSKGVVLHEWAVPEDGDVEDMAQVKAANPFSRISEDTLREKFESPTMSPAHWRRFVCNLPTRAETAAITEAEWHDAATKDRIPAGEPVWAGLDLAWKWDTTALVPLWVKDFEHRLLGDPTVLTPPRDGTSLDPHQVEMAILALHERNPIHTLVMDTNHGEQLATWIESELGIPVIDRGQTNQFRVMDYSRFMEALREGWLKHTGHPEMTRHALNAVARQLPGGDMVFERPQASRFGGQNVQNQRVIDALVAAAMAHNTAAAEMLEPSPAVPRAVSLADL